MKQWHETTEILGQLQKLPAGEKAAIATVVNIVGSAFRRPGAKMIIFESGQTFGGVSGGCLEADVREVARQAMADGLPRIQHYDTGDDPDTFWGLGLGCNGSIDLFIQPLDPDGSRNAWNRIMKLLAGDQTFAVATVVEESARGGSCLVFSERGVTGTGGDKEMDARLEDLAAECLASGRSVYLPGDPTPVFCEVYEPPPRLLLFGAGDDAAAMTAIASAIGFRVTVIDHRPAFLTADRFPAAARLEMKRPSEELASLDLAGDSFAVLMTHSLEQDTGWARQLLESKIKYLGMLGPRDRTATILEGIGRTGDERVFGPVGLDIGADGPEQIALCVLAEILAVREGRQVMHLRERKGAVHSYRSGDEGES